MGGALRGPRRLCQQEPSAPFPTRTGLHTRPAGGNRGNLRWHGGVPAGRGAKRERQQWGACRALHPQVVAPPSQGQGAAGGGWGCPRAPTGETAAGFSGRGKVLPLSSSLRVLPLSWRWLKAVIIGPGGGTTTQPLAPSLGRVSGNSGFPLPSPPLSSGGGARGPHRPPPRETKRGLSPGDGEARAQRAGEEAAWGQGRLCCGRWKHC